MKRVLFLGAVLVLLTGCRQEADSHSATIFAMDTVMEMTVYGDETLLEGAEELVLDMEGRLSVTDSNSEIAALNRSGGGNVSPDTGILIEWALTLCENTGGALDITVYPVVQAWGFTTEEYQVPDEEELSAVLERVGYQKVRLDDDTVTLAPGMEIDLGSMAKGWAGDKILELFRRKGVGSALLNLGGNVQALGMKPDGSPWRVAVRDPSGGGYAGALEIADKAAITSGGYQRFFEEDGRRYHHIIDPGSGYPVDNGMLSVTVVGDEGVVCDGLSTALFVMGLDRAVEFWKAGRDFEAIFITDEGITITDGLKDCFEPLGKYKDTDVEVRYRHKG